MSIKVLPSNPDAIKDIRFHHLLGAIGYESRSRYYFERFSLQAQSRTALIFEEQHVLDFNKNLKFFRSLGFATIDANIVSLEKWAIQICLDAATDKKEPIHVLVDISSMTRQLISALVYYLYYFSREYKRLIEVNFVYSIAEFGEVPSKFGPIISNGPAIKQLAGWSRNPRLACAVVLGIGYEEDLALGLIEDLEAARVWAFRPGGHDPQYDVAINQKNRGLFDEIPQKNLIRYSVYDPYSLFVKLEALLGLSKKDFRLIVVPFGPKIFALSACFAALCHYPDIGIWRVSGGANQEPVDRKAAGRIPSLLAVFTP